MIVVALAGLAVVVLSGHGAHAQFSQIFSDPPPRPPADVPEYPRGGPAQQPTYPQSISPQQNFPQQGNGQQAPLRPPGAVQGGIQSQPLAPPPGLSPSGLPPADTAARGGDTLRGAQGGPAQTLPGLPPGQRQPRGEPQQGSPQQPGLQPPPAEAAVPPPTNEVVVEPSEQKIANPSAVFAGLDKITGRTITFDVAINETVQFGALQVTPRVCYTRPPTESPNTDAFVSVDEINLQGDRKRIFSGWMFAASPGLNAVEHPVYDVWLTDCKGGAATAAADAQPAADGAQGGAPAGAQAGAAPKPLPPRRPAPRAQQTLVPPPPGGFAPAVR